MKRGKRLEVRLTDSPERHVVIDLKSPKQTPPSLKAHEASLKEKCAEARVQFEDATEAAVTEAYSPPAYCQTYERFDDAVNDSSGDVPDKQSDSRKIQKTLKTNKEENKSVENSLPNNVEKKIHLKKSLLQHDDVDERRLSDKERDSEIEFEGKTEKRTLTRKEKRAERLAAWKQQLGIYAKKILGFMLSTMGLFLLLFSYTILGGYLFHEIESPNEITTKHVVKASLRSHIDLLWKSTKRLNVLDKANWTKIATRVIDNYTRVVFLATKNDGWDGNEDGDAELQWSFAGSLLYSVTVITTIGYGHIAPKTNMGRVATIIYAIFGIPLCLLSITHVGGFMATVFRFLYKNIFCNLCCFFCKKLRLQRASKARQASSKNNDAFVNSIDDEDESPSKKSSRRLRWCGCCKRQEAEMHKCTPSREGLLAPQAASQPSQVSVSRVSASVRLQQSFRMMVKWRRGIHNALFTSDNKNIQVPIHISLLLIGVYIALGALLFGLWEKDWNFLIGSYFCFITLSTIGFGDFVPGTSLEQSATQEKLVLCTLYLIVGLALLAMCFDLMQEEARCIFRAFGRKLGLIEDDEDEESGEPTEE